MLCKKIEHVNDNAQIIRNNLLIILLVLRFLSISFLRRPHTQ